MQKLKALLPVLALTLSLTGAQAITFTSDTAIGVGNTNYDGREITVSGCTLTVDGPHAFTSLLVTNGGAVTHSPAPNGEANNRLDLTIAGNVTVAATSAINIQGRGYAPASGPGAGTSSGSFYGSGAGHGGVGGWSARGSSGPGGAYGLLYMPTDFGSGGGYPWSGNAGYGAGAVQLAVAGELRLDGSIVADGTSCTDGGGGGGSGGSVYLTAAKLAGAGTISAAGGNGGSSGGGGAGGRIAIHCSSNGFTGTWSALGGGGANRGGAGTVCLKLASLPTATVWIDNGGNAGGLTRLNPSHWPEGSVFDLIVRSNAVLCAEMPLTFASLRVLAGASVSHDALQPTLVFTVLGDAEIGTNTAVNATGLGFGPASGPGAGTSSGSYYGSGAGHGGLGGWSARGSSGPGGAYGSLYMPTNFGSGGGYPWSGNAGYGGGAVQLAVAGELRLDGSIVADGTSCTDGGGGGGSGGSVYLTAAKLAGAGTISATGGNGGSSSGGGGAGGRVAIHCGSNAFTGTWSAFGGSGANRGGAGTVCLKLTAQPSATVWIDNGGNAGGLTRLNPNQWPTGTTFNLHVAGAAVLYPDMALTFANLDVSGGARLGHAAMERSFNLTVLGDFSLAAGSSINVDGCGYPQDIGPGAGTWSGAYYGSGAGHGGVGGWSLQGSSGPGGIYDSLYAPTDFGSGGGHPWSGNAGSGGGAVRLSVAGELRVDGTISANATSSTDGGGGGGSGGSVYLTTGTLVGNGFISVRGGDGGAGVGGGGAGGRVAIYHQGSTGSITSQIDRTGGTSAQGQAGGWGTIYITNQYLPLEILTQAPTGTLRQAVSSVDVAFNQPVRSETFTPADVLVTTPAGPIPVGNITVTALSSATFRIGFPMQAAPGAYQVQVGPHLENLYGQEMAATYVGSFAITNPVVAGFVKRAGGVPLANVLLSASGGLATRTDTNGAYVLTMPPGWTGTVTPTNAGWVFTPGSLSYVSLTADATNENFTASLAEPLVLTTTRSANSLQFRWPSALGLEYQLQSATNLPVTTWLDEGAPFPGTGGVMSTNLSLGPEPKRFFRLQIEN